MHIDEEKRFDKRNLERNIKNGIITQKDYEIYLSKLSDVSDKVFDEEESDESKDLESQKENEAQLRKREVKKKIKGKGK
jgi:hypothetical protein